MRKYIEFEIAKKYLHEACAFIGGNGGMMLKIKFDEEPTIELPPTDIEKLPSAQSEQQWIPCEERMPDPSEDGKNFLVTVSEIRSYNTNGDYYKKEDRWVTIEQFFFVDGNAHFFRAWYEKSKIIAWMPLAEPFNEGKMETEKLSRCPKCGEYTSVKSGACEYCGKKIESE